MMKYTRREETIHGMSPYFGHCDLFGEKIL